jgi:ubiquinone/menaquinone biosynthesis C-methylase UbiE
MSKYKEWSYNFWQGQFGCHSGYMISGRNENNDANEFYIIREKVLKHVKNGESLLDIGCASGGTYLHIKEYSKKKIKYKGTDFARNFVKACKERNPETEWEMYDAREIHEKDNSWDNVLLYGVMDYLTQPNEPLDWKKALDEAVRVAKKRVIIVIWARIPTDKLSIKEHLKDKVKVRGHKITGQLLIHEHYMLIGEK